MLKTILLVKPFFFSNCRAIGGERGKGVKRERRRKFHDRQISTAVTLFFLAAQKQPKIASPDVEINSRETNYATFLKIFLDKCSPLILSNYGWPRKTLQDSSNKQRIPPLDI